MGPAFGAGMHLMSWERMDVRNDQVRSDVVYVVGVGLLHAGEDFPAIDDGAE